MTKPNRKLRVGVTIHIRDGHQSIWENGIFQNCVFLVQLFNLSPEVEKAVLVNGSGAKEVHPSMMFSQVGVEMIDLPAALETLDVVIEMSSQVPEDWLAKFRARGGRIAWMRCGNDYVIDIERAMYGLPPGGLCSAKKYDAVWTLPEYEHSCSDYFAITTRAPVKIVPHLWTPEFFNKGIATLPAGLRFGYQPEKPRWRVCCFEPNMCMVKTSITPMLVCEEAYRKAPEKFDFIRICNTLKAKENPAFVRFARSLDIVNHGIASFEGRFAIFEYMAHFGDCIVSHHWENGQNYLYYEALYGGYPLIHNSEFIRDLGYFYPDFDCQAGGKALVRAVEVHDTNLEEYKAKSAEFLKTLDIQYQPNIEAYTGELIALFDSSSLLSEPVQPQKKSSETAAESLEIASRPIEKIWVINLERRPDRLEKFKYNHPDLANEIHVLKAYDGRSLRLTPKIARLFAPNNFAWNKATMGCSLSHLDLWYRLAQEPDENARYLILEDDTRLSPGWREIVEQAFTNGDVPSEWDVLYLGGVLPKNEETFAKCKEKVSGNVYQVVPNGWFGQKPPNRYFHFGAYAYMLSHKGAKNLLRYINLKNGIWQQADFDLGYVFPPTYPVQLKHYFFEPFLAHCYQDLELEFQKSYSESASEEPKKIDSDIWKASDCFEESIAKAMVSMSEPYDICGALEEARMQMHVPSNTKNVKISLLHATRGRPIQALDAKELWLKKAKFPKRVEHVFDIDHDDAESIALKQHTHVIQLQDGYSVGAWNLAASKCTGDILIQLSDDWLPPDGWDDLIASRLNTDCEEVLWIDDGNRKDDLICMAILTRKYYLRHSLFDPVFKNVYSDNDFTLRARKAGAVVDARDIKIKHDHPTIGAGKSIDATYERGNQSAEYERAKAIFESKHFPKIYSQNEEQYVIEEFFGGAPGVLWDFGCNDGITLSNSHHILKNKGWKGILVDASPVCIEKAVALYAGRQDIQILNIGLGEKNGVFDFYESGTHLGKGDLSLVSSFKKESTQRWKPTTEYHVKKIQVCDFKTFLGDHARYKQADFITIDIGGLDYEILVSIDLDQTQTRLVCVEHNGHDIQKYIDY